MSKTSRTEKITKKKLNTDAYAEELIAMTNIREMQGISKDFFTTLKSINEKRKKRNTKCDICNREKPEIPDPETGYCDKACRLKATVLGPKAIKLKQIKTFKNQVNAYKGDITALQDLLQRVNNLDIQIPDKIPDSVLKDINAGIDSVNNTLLEINKEVDDQIRKAKGKVEDAKDKADDYVVNIPQELSANQRAKRVKDNIQKRKDAVNEAYKKCSLAKLALELREIKISIEKVIRRNLDDLFSIQMNIMKDIMNIIDAITDIDVAGICSELNVANKMVTEIEKERAMAYDTAYEAIVSFIPASLTGESINFFITPKSLIWHPGPKLTNEFKNLNIGISESAMDFINWDKVNGMMAKHLKEITMDDLSKNKKSIKGKIMERVATKENLEKVKNMMRTAVTLTSEPLPKYENLKISNPRYSLWAFTCWGPIGARHFGIP